MINDFHFSHEFLGCDSLSIPIINDAILESWQKYGCLVIPTEKIIEYFEWLKYQDKKSIQKWKTAISHYLVKNMKTGYKSVEAHSDIADCFNYADTHQIRTILLNQSEFKSLGLNDGKHSRDRTEIININNFSESDNFNLSKQLENKGILDNEDINKIWNERFLPIANNSKRITIIDRYLFSNLYDDINKRKTSVEKLLELLSVTGRKYSITIYSDGDSKDSDKYTSITNYFDRVIFNKPYFKNTVNFIEMNSCDESLFKKKAHDRFIQFDDFTIQLGSGLSIFRDFPINACCFSFYRSTKDQLFSSALSTMAKRRQWIYKVD